MRHTETNILPGTFDGAGDRRPKVNRFYLQNLNMNIAELLSYKWIVIFPPKSSSHGRYSIGLFYWCSKSVSKDDSVRNFQVESMFAPSFL